MEYQKALTKLHLKLPGAQRKRLIFVIQLCVGLVLLAISFNGVQWNLLTVSEREIQPAWIGVTSVLVLAGLALKLLRWQILLADFKIRAPVMRLTRAYFLGMATNIISPVRSGELVRIGLMIPTQSRNTAAIAATIALEKYLDLLFLSGFTLFISLYLPTRHFLPDKTSFLVVSIAATGMLILGVVFGPRLWAMARSWVAARQNRYLNKFCSLMDRLVESSLWLRQPGKLIPLLGISAAAWLVMLLTNYALFFALNLQVEWMAAAVVLVMVYLGATPGLTPGNIGPFHLFAQMALKPFNIPQAEAVLYSILLHMVVTLLPLIISGFCLLLPERDGWHANPQVLPERND